MIGRRIFGRTWTLVTATAVGLAAWLGAVGCSKSLDRDKLTAAIRDQAQGITVSSVQCPPELPAQAGQRFQCIVTAENGVDIVVDVEQTDEQGSVQLQFGKGYLLTENIVADLEADIEFNREADVTLTCPPAVALPANTGTITCDGKDQGGDRFAVTIRVEDGKASLDDYTITELG
ncbi:MAG: DUF4333 domain-containing protein [Acidimicrobiales bacterium]|nr:DUF4333 domain-containing protein [Acidimicrobiales bacterium]